MVTPGTLFIAQSQITTPVVTAVALSAISTSNLTQSNLYHVSRDANGPNNADNSTWIFEGSRTIMSRLLTAAAATGGILPLAAPAVNSSYQIQFYGPYVSCETTSNSTIIGMMQDAIQQTMTIIINNATEIYNGYFAYVPDLSSPDRMGMMNERDSVAWRSSNQLWIASRSNGTGWTETDFPKCPNTEYMVCQLYNTTYDLTISFQNGEMTVTHAEFKDLSPVVYPPALVNITRPEVPAILSYSAYMWSLTELLVGSLGLYADNITTGGTAYYNNILSNIQNTALLGASNLDCFFGVDWMFSNVTWSAPSAQRKADINFARNNQSLNYLIPELSFNLTVSLMSDDLLA